MWKTLRMKKSWIRYITFSTNMSVVLLRNKVGGVQQKVPGSDIDRPQGSTQWHKATAQESSRVSIWRLAVQMTWVPVSNKTTVCTKKHFFKFKYTIGLLFQRMIIKMNTNIKYNGVIELDVLEYIYLYMWEQKDFFWITASQSLLSLAILCTQPRRPKSHLSAIKWWLFGNTIWLTVAK